MPNVNSLDLEYGSGQYASVADTASLSITGDITLSCWLKVESFAGAAPNVILGKFNEGAANQRSYSMLFIGEDSETSTIAFRYDASGDGNNRCVGTSSTAVSKDIWTHVVGKADVSAETVRFNFNGGSDEDVVESKAGTPTSIVDGTAAFAIGCNFTAGTAQYFYDGLIDDVRAYSELRSSGENAADYQQELTGSETNLEGYWKLNNDYLDETSNDNDLTATGSPVFSSDVPFVGAAEGGGSFLFNML